MGAGGGRQHAEAKPYDQKRRHGGEQEPVASASEAVGEQINRVRQRLD
jgi:hypothetical protein